MEETPSQGEALRLVGDDPSYFLEDPRKFLRKSAEFATDIARLATPSTAFGLFLLVAYLGRVGAPLPIADTSTVFLLLLVVASYGFMSCFLLAFVCSPIYTCRVDPKHRETIRTRPLRLLRPSNSWPLSDEPVHSEYLVFHGASILLFPAVAANIAFETSPKTLAACLIGVMLIGIAFSLIKYLALSVMRARKKLKQVACVRIVAGSLLRWVMTVIWMSALYALFITLAAHTSLENSPNLKAYVTGGFLALMLLYMMFTSVQMSVVRFAVGMPFMAFALAMLAPSLAGGLALRVCYRHGDVVLIGVPKLPEKLKPEKAKPLAVGEATGHAHRFTDGKYRFWKKGSTRFVQVIEPSTLVHEEHRPIIVAPGVYEQRAEREWDYTKESAHRVFD